MQFITALSTLFWNSFRNDYVRSTLHAITSVFLSCISLDYGTTYVQNFNIYQSLGYFIADLRYVIVNKQHPTFVAHHLLSIFILLIFPYRHPNTLLYSKLMLIETSNPFINIHLVDKTCKIKWTTATITFFLFRIIYFPIVVLANISKTDELFYASLLFIGNIWWFTKHLSKRNHLL